MESVILYLYQHRSESVDAPTLSYIHKPVDTLKVCDAFQKMLALKGVINQSVNLHSMDTLNGVTIRQLSRIPGISKSVIDRI